MVTQPNSEKARRVFVLADTHNRLPESVREMAKGADEIWHLGDVCAETILDELRAIGVPVVLVRGNCDSNFEWPLVIDIVRGGLKFRLQHIPPDHPPDNVDVLLHGHTHVPRSETRGRVRFLNPGCVTRPNRGSPPSVAWLEIGNGKVNWKLMPLRLPRFLIYDSLLIKSVAIAFLVEGEFGSPSNFCAREALAAVVDCRRAELGGPNGVEPDQHFRVARRLSYSVCPHLSAGAKDFGTNAEALRTEPGRAIRPFPTGCRWNQNVDQGRHRSGACRQSRAFSGARYPRRCCHPDFGCDSVRAKHDCV